MRGYSLFLKDGTCRVVEASDFYFDDGKIIFCNNQTMLFANNYTRVAMFILEDVKSITSRALKSENDVA